MAAPPRHNQLHLETALKCGWVEFWYQPKINLQKKQLGGLEAFARVRHPQLGILSASQILLDAIPEQVTTLSEQALISVLRISEKLRLLGMSDISLATNFDLNTLARVPINALVQQYCGSERPQLIFDVTEKQVMENIPRIEPLGKMLNRNGFRLAIDDFGSSLLSTRGVGTELEHGLNILFAKFKRLTGTRFVEVKLALPVVHEANSSRHKRILCQNIISLAHSMGSTTVAIGIEKIQELETLKELGCDMGQGILLGGPMPEEVLVASLQRRAVKKSQKAWVSA